MWQRSSISYLILLKEFPVQIHLKCSGGFGNRFFSLPLDMNSVCLCCGGDEDDEEQQEEPEEEDDKTPARVPSVNPGWFGKGCRKKVKYKRR